MKPGDFLIGVLEFFAVLVPGALLGWILLQHVPADLLRDVVTIEIGTSPYRLDGNGLTLAFAIVSYALGYVVYLIGAWLDGLYDVWRIVVVTGPRDQERRAWVRWLVARLGGPPPARRRLFTWCPDDNYAAARALRDAHVPAADERALSTYKWAKEYVRLHDAGARAEIDRLEADSKLFRGLVVVCAVATALAIAQGFRVVPPERARVLAWAATAAGLAAVAFWAYCGLRWKMTERAYALSRVVHAHARPASAARLPRRR